MRRQGPRQIRRGRGGDGGEDWQTEVRDGERGQEAKVNKRRWPRRCSRTPVDNMAFPFTSGARCHNGSVTSAAFFLPSFFFSSSRALSGTLRDKRPFLHVGSPSVSLPLSLSFLMHTHTHTLPCAPFPSLQHSHTVWFTYIKPAGGKDQEKNTHLWVFL